MKISIGTRGSQLALKQADIARQALLAQDPTLEVSVKVIETRGDRDQAPIPLDQIGKGWFTGEIERQLQSGEIDIAVHSLKDMAEDDPPGLVIAAYLPREDARDCIVTKHGEPLEALQTGAIVGTDSTRRQAQLLALRPDLQVKSIRGNVPKRLEKLQTENYDAVILAVAGLKRLGLEGSITRIFEPDEMTPAPGQGTLAVQAKADHPRLQSLLAAINDPNAARAALLERSFSRTVGGGCKSPTGAYARRQGGSMYLIGMLVENGTILREETTAPADESDALGEELGRKLLEQRSHA